MTASLTYIVRIGVGQPSDNMQPVTASITCIVCIGVGQPSANTHPMTAFTSPSLPFWRPRPPICP